MTRLQQVGTPLNIEEQLTHPRSLLRSVLINSLFFPRTGPSTFILDQQDENGRLLGLAQIRTRPGRPDRDVVFMSPALETGNGNHAIWQRLLTHLCVQTAERGCFRLYASLPVDSEEFHLFKNIGFIKYSQEDIYQFNPTPPGTALETNISLRPQQASDGWGLQQLYATVTPRPVQNIEGLGQGLWALPQQRWGEPGCQNGYVWEENGELLGALHLRTGKRGYWMRTLLHPEAIDQAKALAKAALNLTGNKNPHLPVYFAVRQYEIGWRSVLTDLGFVPLTTQTLVVKPMVVRVRDKSPALIPGLESSSESAATPAISHAESMEPRPVPQHRP
ncbi:MAG: hypothetical protein JW953_07550 [Anaerolineae bacterium]|nr:hypothetical protein [Anaerolineae bacterium]